MQTKRLLIKLASAKQLVLPVSHNQLVQGLIYNLLDKVTADFLHNEGYERKKRIYKFFNFSEILEKGKFIKEKRILIFPETISFYLASPVTNVLEEFARNSLMKEKLRLGENDLFISSIEVTDTPIISKDKIRINTLSPIEVHSTPVLPNGKKLTHYYAPGDKGFTEQINENLRRKWEAYFEEECLYNLEINPVQIKYCRQIVKKFKGIIIKSWKGHFWLKGDIQFLNFALAVGLGSRSSQGFGMIEVVEERKKSE